jgi:uncharacterized protein YndB with AHSA1/START domain
MHSNAREAGIRLERRLRAPPERVFAAWRDPRDLEQWAWGTIGRDCRAAADFRVGGALSVSTLRKDGARWTMSGVYVEIVPARRIVHTLAWDAPMGYEPADERITAEFVPTDGGTSLVFQHDGALSPESFATHREGWEDVLAALARVVESGGV